MTTQAKLLSVLPLLFLFGAACGKSDSSGAAPIPLPTYPAPTKKAGMTWYKDVQPIVQEHCQGCHNAGGIGPFPLTSYQEAFPVHMPMTSAVVARRMPPWLPTDDCQPLKDKRRLTQDQVDAIYSWSEDGAPAGNPADAPPPPMPAAGLAWVDRKIDAGAPFTPSSTLTDDYHCLPVDPQLTSDQVLVGYNFIPGVRSQVHHVLIYAVSAQDAAAKDQAEAGVGWTCFGGPGINNTQLVAAWVPGTSATVFPSGTGIPIKAGTVLAMQVHYNMSSGPPKPDQSALELQFARSPIERPALLFSAKNAKFRIPAGATGYTADATLPIDQSGTLWGVGPHMHTLGRQASLTLNTAGQSSCLIAIPKWDRLPESAV